MEEIKRKAGLLVASRSHARLANKTGHEDSPTMDTGRILRPIMLFLLEDNWGVAC
jgi:hypothetical protein